MTEYRLSKLQQDEFYIFKEFIQICSKNELAWFICDESFLEAVRHGEVIPWDDDIDVAMSRPDFEKFPEIVPRYLPEELYLCTYKSGAEHITLVAQILNKNKSFTLNHAEKQDQTGAWIDILVIDSASVEGIKRKLFSVRYMYYWMINQFAHFSEIVNLNKIRPWYEKVTIKVAQMTNIEAHLDAVKIGDSFHKLLKSNPYEKSDEVGTFMGAAIMFEILLKRIYGVGTDFQFERISVKESDMYEGYLGYFYRDYMTLPPLGERNRYNVFGRYRIVFSWFLSGICFHAVLQRGGVPNV